MDVVYLQKLKDSPELQDIEWKMCQQDPYYFLTTWARTLDTHANGKGEKPIRPFPKKRYIKIIVKTWLAVQLLLIPKTRQMMMSWIFTGLYLWDTMFHPARLTFFQSKKADDADDLVKRAKFIWDNLPSFLQRYEDETGRLVLLRCNPQHNGQHVQGKMLFPQINSEIRGIPEGGDVIRMHTASGILSDEMAFQPEAESAWTAARPTISGQGKFTGVSTAEDNTFFEDLVFDKDE